MNNNDIIVLYTTHCPLCRGVEMLLKKKKVTYTEVTDAEEIRNKGFHHVPVLQVNDKYLTGKEIHDYLNSLK